MDIHSIHGGAGERSSMKRYWAGAVVFCIFFLGSSSAAVLTSPHSGAGRPDPLPMEQPARMPGVATLVAVGDTIVHSPMMTAAWDPKLKSYDFRPMFQHVRADIEGADLGVGVLETVLGAGVAPYSGYPRFNSPDAVADALQWAGLDVVFTAHNHMLDHGTQALFRTLDHLDSIGLDHVGSARKPLPELRMVMRRANGVKIAFLSYTTITNGFPVPASMPWAVNLYHKEIMAADVARARAAGADFVVAALHAGVEYQRRPDASQRKVIDEMVAAGVDVVLGSHPHAVQPFETRRVKNPDGSEKEAVVFYSLGNFISNQIWRYSDCGLIVWLTLAKQPDGPPRLAGLHWHAVWVHRHISDGRRRYRVLPVDERGSAAYVHDKLLTPADRERMQQVWEETRDLLEQTP